MNKKSNWIFIVAVLAVGGLLFALSGKKMPRLPLTPHHVVLKENSECAPCHGPGQKHALRPNHPPKEQCLTCHIRPQEAK